MSKEKPKVLLVVHSLAGGGIERVLLSICRRLKKFFSFQICCLVEEGPLAGAFRDIGIPTGILGGVSSTHPRYFFSNTMTFAKLLSHIRRSRPAVVQAEMFYAGTLGRTAALLCKVPVIVHGVHNFYPWKKPIHRLVDRLLSRPDNSVLVCPTRAVAAFTSSQSGIPLAKFKVIHNGVEGPVHPAPPVKQARLRFGIDGDCGVIVFCARMVEQKRPEFVVRVFARLLRYRPGATLIMAGDGPLLEQTKRLAVAEGVSESVVFTGMTDDVYHCYRAADLLVAPSSREGFGLAAAESMLAGTPALLSDIPAFREVFDFLDDSFFVKAPDAQDWCERIVHLLDRPELLEQASKTGAAQVKARYRPEEMVQAYRLLYERPTIRR